MTVGPEGPAPLPRRIVLTGFMGAGKSTVGPLLASRLGWRFLDIDTLITTQQGLAVAEIFARHGEQYFRRLEAETIATELALDDRTSDSAVIALGGGAIETEDVRQLLFSPLPRISGDTGESVPTAVTIYLEAPLAELLARCRRGDETPIRPLLAAIESPADRLTRRLPHYRRAHLTVDTGGASPADVVDRIQAWLTGAGTPDTATQEPRTNGAAR